MSAQELRNVLLKVALDGEFYNLMLVNPNEALKDYNLTDDEKKTLNQPTLESLRKYTAADGWVPPSWVIIWAIKPIIDPMVLTEAQMEQVARLVGDIRNSVGSDRFDKIMQLVQQAQPENQIQRELPGHE